jgi:hypothetical protein
MYKQARIAIEAERIYQTWKDQGQEALAELLEREYTIPPGSAKRIAKAYGPKQAPVVLYDFEEIKKAVKKKQIFDALGLTLDSKILWPKQLLAWYLLRHIFGPEVFDFRVNYDDLEDPTGRSIIFDALPADPSGNPIKTELFAMEVVPFQGIPAYVSKKSAMLTKHLGNLAGDDLSQTLLDASLIFPRKAEIAKLAEIIQRGFRGEEINLLGVFCPDYSYETTGNPSVPYRYTFEDVSGGVGLVAQQFLRVLPHLVKFFDRHGLKYRIKIGIADIEAESEEILKRVKKDKEEFINLCAQSLEAFRQGLPDIEMDLCLLGRDWINGRWPQYVGEAKQSMLSGIFGNLAKEVDDPMREIVFPIVQAGRKFYCDWYGREMDDSELAKMVIMQGADYAALGRIISDDFSGQAVIQIAGDRQMMQEFNRVYSDHLTICCKRVY